MDIRIPIINNDYYSFKNALIYNIEKINWHFYFGNHDMTNCSWEDYKYILNRPTMLYHACEMKKNKIAKLLLKQKNIDINKLSANSTALDIAVDRTNFNMIKHLLIHPKIKINKKIFYRYYNTKVTVFRAYFCTKFWNFNKSIYIKILKLFYINRRADLYIDIEEIRNPHHPGSEKIYKLYESLNYTIASKIDNEYM